MNGSAWWFQSLHLEFLVTLKTYTSIPAISHFTEKDIGCLLWIHQLQMIPSLPHILGRVDTT
jgi:hypothetical protein